MKRIVLIQCVNRRQGAPGLGLAYLASYIRERIKDIEIVILEQTPKDINKVMEHSPDLIGLSVLTPQFPDAIELSKKLKKHKDVPIIIGGSHITACPQFLPDYCDIGVIGEGEETLFEIIAQQAFTSANLANIKGICFHQNGEIVVNPRRPLINNLDEIPFPAWDLLDMEHYLRGQNVFGPHFGRGTHLLTSRGCPYNCTFCFSPVLWQKHYRSHSAEYSVEEIKQLVENYSVNMLHLYDDISVLDKKRLRRMADLLVKEGLHKEVKFGIVARCNMFDEEICDILKQMNVIHVNFGIESGNERVLKFLKNNTLKKEEIERAVRITQEYGFTVDGGLIIGSPGETAEEMFESLEFIKSLKLDKFCFKIATPYPGTKLWEILEKEGRINFDVDWRYFDTADKDVLKHKDKIFLCTEKVKREEFFRIWEVFENERKKSFAYDWRKHN
jgi:radical SAM superfamily enzyme YgiQ (UPF0313 family)